MSDLHDITIVGGGPVGLFGLFYAGVRGMRAKVIDSLKRKPEMVHVILTGRNAHPTIVEAADTVTEMRQVKHAYEKGVMAQRGIEY